MSWKIAKKIGGPITMRYSVGQKVAVVTETPLDNGCYWGASVSYSDPDTAHASMLIGPLLKTSNEAVAWCEQYLAKTAESVPDVMTAAIAAALEIN